MGKSPQPILRRHGARVIMSGQALGPRRPPRRPLCSSSSRSPTPAPDNGPIWLRSRKPALLSLPTQGRAMQDGPLMRRGSCRSERNHGLMLEKLSGSIVGGLRGNNRAPAPRGRARRRPPPDRGALHAPTASASLLVEVGVAAAAGGPARLGEFEERGDFLAGLAQLLAGVDQRARNRLALGFCGGGREPVPGL